VTVKRFQVYRLDLYSEDCSEYDMIGDTQTVTLAADYDALQAKIDMLMLEYCPEEMTAEQKRVWADNQRLAKTCGCVGSCEPDKLQHGEICVNALRAAAK
jgi:hypothetical protein